MTLLTPSLVASLPDGQTLIPMIIAAFAGFMLLTGLRRQHRKRAQRDVVTGPRPPVELSERINSKERLRRDLEVLIGELQDLSRKVTADIDTRFTKLEAAIHDADRRIAVLNRLSHAGAHEPATGEPFQESPDQDIRYAVVYELADAGFSPIEIARDLGKTPGEIELILNLRRTAQS